MVVSVPSLSLGRLPKPSGVEEWVFNEVVEDVETDIKYEGYINREKDNAKKINMLKHFLKIYQLRTCIKN